MESDRVIKNYEPRKFKIVYVAQRKVGDDWIDLSKHDGPFPAGLDAQQTAYFDNCEARVVEREVEVTVPPLKPERKPPTGPSGGSDTAWDRRQEAHEILPLRDAYVFWPEYDR